jgi:tRNA(fMet)-specific endonuclease VapC
MRYLLDANVIIAMLNSKDTHLAKRIRRHKPSDVAISSIVMHELYYGAFKSQRLEHNVNLIDNIFLEVIDFDREDAQAAGEIRAMLTKKGTIIGPYDILIAGQAKARNMILVTSNTNEFRRVPNLRIEDWSL